MNVYEMEGFLRGKCVPRDLIVNESNAAYLVRKLSDIASVKAERDAQQKRADSLAVENAALKDVFGSGEAVVNFLSIALRHTKYDCIDLPDVALAFKMSLPEIPATDAALAAIRLDAKIEGANELAERIAEMHSKTAPGSNIEKKLMFAAEAAIAYANGLREAK
ncbi:hypothetical protein [Serratia ureilytica]|uniref:hypothetical protein n=1 Tax=Serratia ureilytica TaxID=300181 RepID=UPI0018D5C3A9|nr:hypothetical protein [Serratia ureilytica]MBH3006797.1 hypothetical protein [Serratia ureilytica]